jgi:hypothetical protein
MLSVQHLIQEIQTTNGIQQAAHASVHQRVMLYVLPVMETTLTSSGMRQAAHASVFH